MNHYHLLEAKIDGVWLHCFNLECGLAFNLAEGAALTAAIRERGFTLPIRLREVGSYEEMLVESTYAGQQCEEIRMGILDRSRAEDDDDHDLDEDDFDDDLDEEEDA